MPVTLIDVDYSPLVVDYEFEISDKLELSQYVAELVLGHHFHIARIINELSSAAPSQQNDSIDHAIEKVRSASYEKRDGWLFQMISWIVLALRHKGQKFYSNHPHFAAAQHGIDGLAIRLKADNSLDCIIITEDKCTSSPRNKIKTQVFPEFEGFEEGKKNNALVSIIATLIGQLDSGAVFTSVQNDIFDNSYRVYRIGITRQVKHNDEGGRKKLFKKYDSSVTGDSSRRTGASIYLDGMRKWMKDFSDMVITYLESKKTSDV